MRITHGRAIICESVIVSMALATDDKNTLGRNYLGTHPKSRQELASHFVQRYKSILRKN